MSFRNQELKFRARGGDELEYFVFFGLFDQTEDYVIDQVIQSDGSHHVLQKSDIMSVDRYTGLLDKNGKEIYEGDIVENTAKVAWVVEFDSEQGRYRYFRPENSLDDIRRTGFGLTNNQSKMLKVIGNIYENSDSLV